jgi:hypothetical protein
MADRDWRSELVGTGNEVSAQDVLAAMRRYYKDDNKVAQALQDFMQSRVEETPPSAEQPREPVTLERLAQLLNDPEGVKKLWASATPEEQDAIKKVLTSAPVQPMTQSRPYRFDIAGKPGYYQVIDNKWKKLTFSQDRKWVVTGDAPPYILNNLNAIKKKVDAQRASGNLTDSKLSKTKRL